MTTKITATDRSPAGRVAETSTRTAISRDGTTIGYRQLVQGLCLVILHGTASSRYNQLQLAAALADAFTVYLPDRRGRGPSGPYRAEGTLQTEIEDLEAVLEATGVQVVFGVSSGGRVAAALIAAMRGARMGPPVFNATPRWLPERLARWMLRSEERACQWVRLDALQAVLPVAARLELPGLDHAASWNRDRGGHPEPVADALRRSVGQSVCGA